MKCFQKSKGNYILHFRQNAMKENGFEGRQKKKMGEKIQDLEVPRTTRVLAITYYTRDYF